MCKEHSLTSPMMISDVDKEVFTIMLRSLYRGEILPEEWQEQENSEAILKTASKYGFSTLKSEAEVWYASSLNFTVDNVIDEFMTADGNSKALVKAAAMKKLFHQTLPIFFMNPSS